MWAVVKTCTEPSRQGALIESAVVCARAIDDRQQCPHAHQWPRLTAAGRTFANLNPFKRSTTPEDTLPPTRAAWTPTDQREHAVIDARGREAEEGAEAHEDPSR